MQNTNKDQHFVGQDGRFSLSLFLPVFLSLSLSLCVCLQVRVCCVVLPVCEYVLVCVSACVVVCSCVCVFVYCARVRVYAEGWRDDMGDGGVVYASMCVVGEYVPASVSENDTLL